jgi:hypothetical protein
MKGGVMVKELVEQLLLLINIHPFEKERCMVKELAQGLHRS